MNTKFAVMLFYTQLELGISNKPNQWVNTSNVVFDDPLLALEYYANTKCPASQIIKAKDDYELQCKIGEMILNYMDEKWLNKNLYPYL